MSFSLKEKEGYSVLVVEPASSVRQMISDVVKDLGFKNIFCVSSGKEALHVLEVEKISWIIASNIKETSQDSSTTAFHLLKLITTKSKLRSTLTSLLIDVAQEGEYLPYAFELGLLSFHPKSYVKDLIVQEFETLFSLLKGTNWNSTLTSAEYLRGFLSERRKFQSLLSLEENLLSMHPGSALVLFHLAEAEFANQRNDAAVSALAQVELLEKKLSVHCKRLKEKYLGSSDPSVTSSAKIGSNILGIKNAVIIDADTDVLFHVSELLKAVGVKNIEQFENGATAFQWLDGQKKEPDLIIMEWKTIGISGPVLIQRIRQIGYLQAPVVVISSLIENDDIHILREMEVDFCQKKPFEHNDFYTAIILAIQQNRCPTEQKSLQLKIRKLLNAGKIEEAKRLMGHLFTDERAQKSSKLEVEAEYMFALNMYKKARDKGIEAIRQGGDSLLMLNLVGKAMLKLREFDGALKCFEKANSISSLNVERLLNVAQASLELDNHEKAVEAVGKAKKLDFENTKVAEVECQIRVEVGTAQQAQALMEKLDSGRNIISFMNNRAVTLARNGRFEDSIILYKKTLASLPDKWRELHAIVSYNIGLAYARYGDLELADNVIKDVAEQKQFDIAKKAASLSKRLAQCVKSGQKLELQEDDQSIEQNPAAVSDIVRSDDALSEIVANFEARRGDICCYLAFFYIEGDPQKSKELLKNMPHFRERDSIERAQTNKA